MKTDTIVLKPEGGLGPKPPEVPRLRAILGAWFALVFLLAGTLTAVAGNLSNSGFRFATSVFTVAESNPMVILQVLRASPALRSMTVDYYTEPSTATPGTDYTPVSGTLQFQPADAFKEIRIPILNDGIRELSESFLVILTNASPGEILGLRSFISVSIQDNDPGFAFASSSYTAVEGAGEINISVNRGTDLPGAVTVDYSTLPGTATPDVEYVPVAGTLTFSENEASKTIRIPLVKDGLKESTETFSLILSNPSAGTALGTKAKTTVTIQDDDPGFSFGALSYDVSETGTEVVLTVNRGTDTPGEISVDYFSEPLTATADIDYIPVTGTLTFKPEESFKTIVVPIINDGFKEPVQTFRLVLTNASPGTAISGLSKTTVRILDNDLGFRFESTSYIVSEEVDPIVQTKKREN
ncbi:MAG: hypothetical protein JWM99_2064 [Verrucomicrobiales bacterium]|nr:hypothetical protein [Verrucomicrobiales bacterium]